MRKGIRRRLILLYIAAAAVECLMMLAVSAAVWASAYTISSSYNSNIRLEEYSRVSDMVFQDLDDYMVLKSYDNINSYFKDKAQLERLILDLSRKPSMSKILVTEYSVYKLTETFLNYADSAVYLRRSGDTSGAQESFKNAEKAFAYLHSSIDRLNQLYFSANIHNFQNVRSLATKVTFSGSVVVASVSLLVVLILSIFVTAITQPLTEISERANQLAERNFDIPLFTYNMQDEIGNICRAFNRMIVSIREYIDAIWEKAIKENELREREMKMTELYQDAKLNALQAQINPHFLFNTLNTGAQLAMMEGNDRTCDFLEKVADFYRYNLQFTGRESVLRDEIQLLESYVYIMKVRFGERFNYSTDIDSDHLEVQIPGMILQPLVENCIKHGFASMPKDGKVLLKVRDEEGFVVVTVNDNGPGFPENRKNEILTGNSQNKSEQVVELEDKDSGTGVGLVNVLSRLQMFYKSKDVFDIQKSELGGTAFVIRIKV